MAPIGRRILVIDDDPAIRAFFLDLLREEGHRVETADTVAVARALAVIQRPDLVISDVSVWECAPNALPQVLAHDSQFRGLPLILCTALAPATIDELQSLLPANLYVLAKPFEIDDLLDRIADFLNPLEPTSFCE